MPASRKTIRNCAPPAGEGERTVTVTAAPAGSASETTGSVISRSESLSASVAWVPYKDVTISGGGSAAEMQIDGRRGNDGRRFYAQPVVAQRHGLPAALERQYP